MLNLNFDKYPTLQKFAEEFRERVNTDPEIRIEIVLLYKQIPPIFKMYIPSDVTDLINKLERNEKL